MMNIIPQATPKPAWQQSLSQAFTRPQQLLSYLDLPLELASKDASRDFPFRVTRSYAARMLPKDPDDPLLRQVLPLDEEMRPMPGFSTDPVGDLQAQVTPGLLHKYQGRVLLLVTGACAIHCRYCFRRHFSYGDSQLTSSRQTLALAYIAADTTIHEVILSGGDPLVLSDNKLQVLISKLAGIIHVRRFRIHTRLPVVLPNRVDDSLLATLTSTRVQPVIVIHANHANEINDEVSHAIALLKQRGITVFNQSVLLRGVNDTVQDQMDLQENLFTAGALPYYLHLLDPTVGTAHFNVPESTALAIYDQMRRQLPGYLVPKLVREQPKKPYKILIK